jgi:hypothetical protein
LVVILSARSGASRRGETKKPCVFRAKGKEGFFARCGVLRMTAFVFFREFVKAVGFEVVAGVCGG